MFDQSFSHQNFFKIYSYENKRGNNLANRFFTDVCEEYAKIKRARKLIRKIYFRRRYYSKENFDKRVLILYNLLREIKNRKNELVRNHLKDVSNNVSERKFKFTLTKSEKKLKGKMSFRLAAPSNRFSPRNKYRKT